jgi:hypothetical protein
MQQLGEKIAQQEGGLIGRELNPFFPRLGVTPGRADGFVKPLHRGRNQARQGVRPDAHAHVSGVVEQLVALHLLHVAYSCRAQLFFVSPPAGGDNVT